MSQHALLSAGCKAWRSITCPRSELRLDLTLGCGQTFRWRETADGHWTGVMRGKVWTLTQTEDMLWYYVYSHQKNPGTENRQKQKVEEKEQLLGKRSKRMIDMKQEEVGMCTVMSETDNTEEDLLRDYFQLDVKLGDLYRNWSTADPHFKHTANIFTALIITSRGFRVWLTDCVRRSGLSSASLMMWPIMISPLCKILQVADCVCLMSLDKFEALPVDTHVWQIAKRDYNFAAGNSQKTLTDRVYKEIGDFFRKLWGPYAGWAQSVLFCADLKKFQKLREEIPVMKDEKNKMKKRRHDGYKQEQKREKGNKHQRS